MVSWNSETDSHRMTHIRWSTVPALFHKCGTAVDLRPMADLCLFAVVSPEDIGIARGAVAVLAAHSLGGQHRLLIVHEDSGAVVWDLRCSAPLTCLLHGLLLFDGSVHHSCCVPCTFSCSNQCMFLAAGLDPPGMPANKQADLSTTDERVTSHSVDVVRLKPCEPFHETFHAVKQVPVRRGLRTQQLPGCITRWQQPWRGECSRGLC